MIRRAAMNLAKRCAMWMALTGVLSACSPAEKPPVPPKHAQPTAGLTPEVAKLHMETARYYQEIEPGTPQELYAGTDHQIYGTNFIVQFTHLLRDSRCAEGAKCLAKGEVQAQLLGKFDGKTETWVLTTDKPSVVWKGYTLTMQDALPHPSAKPSPGLPRLKLLVEEGAKKAPGSPKAQDAALDAAMSGQVPADKGVIPLDKIEPVKNAKPLPKLDPKQLPVKPKLKADKPTDLLPTPSNPKALKAAQATQ